MPSWAVRVFSQNTPNRCWEACARIMWHYRYFGNDNGYQSAARGYTTLDRGLYPAEMNAFYCGLIGLRSLHNPTAQFRQKLSRGPVIFFTVNGVTGHAMVACGYDATHYQVANPYEGGEMSFDDGGNLSNFTANGRLVLRRRQRIESRLGEYIWFWEESEIAPPQR